MNLPINFLKVIAPMAMGVSLTSQAGEHLGQRPRGPAAKQCAVGNGDGVVGGVKGLT